MSFSNTYRDSWDSEVKMGTFYLVTSGSDFWFAQNSVTHTSPLVFSPLPVNPNMEYGPLSLMSPKHHSSRLL